MRRVMAPGDFRIFDPSMGPNLDQGRGPSWTRDRAQPGPGMGLNLDQSWGSTWTRHGATGPRISILVQGQLTLYENKKSQGFFILVHPKPRIPGPGAPWRLDFLLCP